MKLSDSHADLMKAHVIEQLEALGSYDNDNYSYRELKRKLAVARALEVDVESSSEHWF